MSEIFKATEAEQRVLDAAKLVTSLLKSDFDPLDENFVEAVNSAAYNHKNDQVMTSGSLRHFSSEDIARGTYIDIGEIYSKTVEEGQSNDNHWLTVLLEHPYNNYLVIIDLNTGEICININQTVCNFNPEKRPVVTDRIINCLAVVANDLF